MNRKDLNLPWAPTRRDFLKAAGLTALREKPRRPVNSDVNAKIEVRQPGF